jgi:Tol biopolymer transport system component
MTPHHVTRLASGALACVVLMTGCEGQLAGSFPAGGSTVPDRSPTPTPSPEGILLSGQIIFSRDTYFIANADGSDEHQLADPNTYCCQARISPDHTRILTMPGTDKTGAVRGGMLTLDGTEFDLLPRPDKTLNLVPQAWSPDGKRIAFEGWDDKDPSRTGVYTARIDGSDLVRLTTYPGLPHDMPLDYSPDGRQLVFHRAVAAELVGDHPADLGGSLGVVNVDGSGAHQLDMGSVRPWWDARWSPDGSKILFSSERLQPAGPLWTIKPDGSGLTKVFEDTAGEFAIRPIWSPDGNKIMFTLHPLDDAFEHVDNEIYAINADGTGKTVVVGGPRFKYVADWWE